MHYLSDRLAAGDWVHLLPEGGRTRDPEARMGPAFKAGIGMLIAEAKPLALPFYHYGMQAVLPVGAVRPRAGNHVRMVFGEVTDCNDAWLSEVAGRHGSGAEDSAALWRAIAAETHAAVAGIERVVHPAFAEAQL
jgi:hypothetical protein